MITRNSSTVTSTFLESKKKMSFTVLILTSLSQWAGIMEMKWWFIWIVSDTLLQHCPQVIISACSQMTHSKTGIKYCANTLSHRLQF